MLAITVPSYSDPSGYQLSEVSNPVITQSTDVLIKVHAASVNPIDVKGASGVFKLLLTDEFPYRIGYDCAGVVSDVGDGVTKFKVGDEVYVRLPEVSRGSWSEYVICGDSLIALKPKLLSFGEAASLPLAAVTAMQALQKYRGSLSGKTVFIPAGLSGSGSYACQLAKNVFGAGKVITTVSTQKVEKVSQLLGEGVVDEIIDYTKNDPTKVIPPRSVDFILDTTAQAMSFLSLMTPSTGVIISISTSPSPDQLQRSSFFDRPGNPTLPWFARIFLGLTDYVNKARARRWAVRYEYMFLDSNAKDLETLAQYVEDRKLIPVIGSRVPLRNLAQVQEACALVLTGKGGIGKTVIDVVQD